MVSAIERRDLLHDQNCLLFCSPTWLREVQIGESQQVKLLHSPGLRSERTRGKPELMEYQ